MQRRDDATPEWRDEEFTTYCPTDHSSCVQYAKRDGIVAVRSSLTPGKIAELTRGEWDDLINGVRSGEIS